MLTLILLISAAVYLLYRFLTANYGYWKKKGVPSPPVNCLFGNLGDSITFKKSLGQIYTHIYASHPDVPYVGFYKIRKPGLLLRDPDIIKDVLVKDFNSFQVNDIEIDEDSDPLIAKNPFVLTGHKWKLTRAKLSTCFTTGKIKNVFPHMLEVSKGLIAYLEKRGGASKDGLETKELAAKFTTDNVASCAFGLEGRSFLDEKAEFREVGRKILEPSFWIGLKHLCIFLFPSLTKLISMKFVPDDAAKYLRDVITSTMTYRREKDVVRNDFLDAMAQLKLKPGEYDFTDDDVVAHSLSFFVDGFETSSIALSFALYDLAANSDVQEKLRREVAEVLAKHDGQLTYEAIQDMTYLDCVISESMRLHPAGMFLVKVCTSSYTLPPIREGGNPVHLEAGTPIVIPVYALHCDAKYYVDPERFDPGRFNEANRQNVVKGTYLPFGEGPRMCLGQRFAVLQVKVGVVSVVRSFEVRVNKKTVVPIEIDPHYFMLVAKGGLWLDYRQLEK